MAHTPAKSKVYKGMLRLSSPMLHWNNCQLQWAEKLHYVLSPEAQVIIESRAQRLAAQQNIASVKESFPEVMQAVKTLQLSQEMLLYKEAYLVKIGKTGSSSPLCIIIF